MFFQLNIKIQNNMKHYLKSWMKYIHHMQSLKIDSYKIILYHIMPNKTSYEFSIAHLIISNDEIKKTTFKLY
jgi:ABC-type microcin C transport system permease subunit YejE